MKRIIQEFNNVIKIAPHRLRGKMALLQNDPGKAASHFETALSFDPGNIKIMSDLQLACKRIPDWERFFALYHDALLRWPEKAYIRAKIGTSYMYLSRYKEAATYIETFIQDQEKAGKPFSHNIYSKLGICYAYLGMWEKAKTILEKVESKYPWNVDMIFGQLCVYYGTGQAEQIPNYLDLKIKQYPMYYPLYYWKADYFLRQPEKSLQLYLSALEKVNRISYNRRYRPYYFATDTQCSLETIVRDYLELLSEMGKLRADKSYGLWRWLGFGFEYKLTTIFKDILAGRFTVAGKECKKLLEKKIPPGMRTVILSHLAMAQLGQEDVEAAIISSLEALSLKPDSYYARDVLASVFMKTGEWDKAKDIYESLVSQEPFSVYWIEKLGIVFNELGDFKNAFHTYERVLQMDPYNSRVKSEIKRLKRRTGL